MTKRGGGRGGDDHDSEDEETPIQFQVKYFFENHQTRKGNRKGPLI